MTLFKKPFLVDLSPAELAIITFSMRVLKNEFIEKADEIANMDISNEQKSIKLSEYYPPAIIISLVEDRDVQLMEKLKKKYDEVTSLPEQQNGPGDLDTFTYIEQKPEGASSPQKTDLSVGGMFT